jgi:hypothetical protein
MTIKTIDTGIFTYDEISNVTEAERKLLRENALLLLNLEGRLESLKAWALDVLRKNSAKFRIVDGGFEIVPKPGRQESEVRDANMILNYVGILRDDMKQGKIKSAVLNALTLGQLSVQLHVRPYEYPAAIGRKVQEGGKKGHSRMESHYTGRHKNHDLWLTMAAKMTGSKRAKALRIARETGDNSETIRNTLNDEL